MRLWLCKVLGIETSEKRKERIEAERLEKMVEAREKETEQLAGLRELTKEMISKPCPIRGDDCTEECVHFGYGLYSKADVIYWRATYPHEWLLHMKPLTPPRCKLWKE